MKSVFWAKPWLALFCLLISGFLAFTSWAYFGWRNGHTVAQAEFAKGIAISVINKPSITGEHLSSNIPGVPERAYLIQVHQGRNLISAFEVMWISREIHSFKIVQRNDSSDPRYEIMFDDSYTVTFRYGQAEDLGWAEWKTAHQEELSK